MGASSAIHDSSSAGRISVVVPTLNSAENLPRVLASVRSQDYTEVDLVVVDGGSSDLTPEISQAAGALYVPGPFPRGTARRIGTRAVPNEFVLFLDSDQLASPGLLRECVDLARAQHLDAIVIPETDEARGFWRQCRALDRALAEDPELSYPRFMTRGCYLDAGGHSGEVENYMEDRDLFLRLRRNGRRMGRSARPIVNLVGELNPIELGRKGGRAAVDAGSFYRTHARAGESVWTVMRPRVRRLVDPKVLRRWRLTTIVALPAYWIVVYGPRLVRAWTSR